MAIQQSRVRGPDETVCFKCNTLVKRDASFCPQCGAAISAGPSYAVQGSPAVPGAAPQQSQGLTYSYAQEDVVGVGRWVLNFILAGFVGLAITFFLRKQGWLATWICLGVGILATALLIMAR